VKILYLTFFTISENYFKILKTKITAMSCSEFWSLDQNPRVQTMFGTVHASYTVHMNSDHAVDHCGASKSFGYYI
jgi:hypothetical protein